jgi:signal peptidase I
MTERRPQTDGPPLPFGFREPERMVPWRGPAHPPMGLLPAVQSLLYVLVFALFLMAFTVQPIRIPSSSMEPTLLVGDFLLLDKEATAEDAGGLLPPGSVKRGDVVVFHDPVEDPSIHLVKRVVGMPGDRLHLKDGVVYVNGAALKEGYAVHRGRWPDRFRDDFPSLTSRDAGVNPEWWVRLRGLVRDGEVTVPKDSYFVLGDNRDDSEDSRYWGFVPRKNIVGEPVLIYFSWKLPPAPQPGEEETEEQGRVPENHGPTDFARWDRVFRVVH